MPNTKYDDIAAANYASHFGGNADLTNARLQNYFNGCFQQAIEEAGCYQAWACLGCAREENGKIGFGNRPRRCTQCGSRQVFYVATFQGRAPVVGSAFESAVLKLLTTRFELPVTRTPGNTNTHDLEISNRMAIETKGSPRHLDNPDGSVTTLHRPGMERTDTEKKAFANGRRYRSQNRNSPFFIVTNALPKRLEGYRGEDVTGIFNITQANRTESLVAEINAALA